MKRKTYMRNRKFTSHNALSQKEMFIDDMKKKLKKLMEGVTDNGKTTKAKRQ